MRQTFILLLVVFLCSCNEQFEYISVDEFNNFSDDEFEIIDVRTVEEFQSGYISGAINIDFFSADFIDKIKETDSTLKLILYCRTDNRSSKSAKILVDNNYKNIYVIKGGIEEWISQGNPVIFY
jgi:rhodanese-related sulfurtransferase